MMILNNIKKIYKKILRPFKPLNKYHSHIKLGSFTQPLNRPKAITYEI